MAFNAKCVPRKKVPLFSKRYSDMFTTSLLGSGDEPLVTAEVMESVHLRVIAIEAAREYFFFFMILLHKVRLRNIF